MESLKIKVWRPAGQIDRVATIACDDDHFGALVAAGYMSEAEYWPALVKAARASAKRQLSRALAGEAREADRIFADSFPARWLADTEKDTPND